MSTNFMKTFLCVVLWNFNCLGFFFTRNAVFVRLFLLITMITGGSAFYFDATILGNLIQGEIHPTDPYILESDGQFVLNCSFKQSYFEQGGKNYSQLNSSHMYWMNGGKILDGSYIVDKRTVGILVSNITISMQGQYSCYVNESTIGGFPNKHLVMTEVSIGVPPDPVTEMRCVSYNWQDMTCDWCPDTPPKRLTRYKLYYQIDAMAAECPQPLNVNRGSYCQCNWKQGTFKYGLQYAMQINTTSPFLSRKYALYNFTIDTGYAIVKPGPVVDLAVVHMNSSIVNVSWGPAKEVESIDAFRSIYYTLHYTSEYGDQDEYIETGFEKSVLLTGLRPYTTYSIRVRCKTKESEPIDLYWSDWKSLNTRTLADAPSVGPVVPAGAIRWSADCRSNEGRDCRKVQIHWQNISAINQNGPLREYKYKFNGELYQAGEFSYTSRKLAANIHQDYTFELQAVTHDEQSDEMFDSPATVVHIEKYRNKIPNPSGIVAETNKNMSAINFVWTQDGPKVDNFTLLACQDRSDDTTKCRTSPINVTIEGNKWTYSHNDYNPGEVFALAANKGPISSGLTTEWIPICRYDALAGKPIFTLHALKKHSLNLTWAHVTCSHKEPQGVTLKYNIYWTDGKVTGNTSVEANRNSKSYKYVIENLKPYTTYNVSMEAVSKAGPGTMDAHTKLTLESAPGDPPHNVEISDIQASNFTVSWKQPQIPNGDVTKFTYTVTVVEENAAGTNNRTFEVTDGKTSTFVSGLDGYVNYTVYVVAKNSGGKSGLSQPASAQTLIKAPAIIKKVSAVTANDTTMVLVTWSPPDPPNGPISKYIIYVLYAQNNSLAQYVVDDSKTMYMINFPDCGSDEIPIKVSVSAVTTDDKLEFIGPPSEAVAEQICGIEDSTWIIVGVVLGILLFIGVVVICCCCWRKCQRRAEELPAKVNTEKLMEDNEVKTEGISDDPTPSESDRLLNLSGDVAVDSSAGILNQSFFETGNDYSVTVDIGDEESHNQPCLSSLSSTSSEDSGTHSDNNNDTKVPITNPDNIVSQTSGKSETASGHEEEYTIYTVNEDATENSSSLKPFNSARAGNSSGGNYNAAQKEAVFNVPLDSGDSSIMKKSKRFLDSSGTYQSSTDGEHFNSSLHNSIANEQNLNDACLLNSLPSNSTSSGLNNIIIDKNNSLEPTSDVDLVAILPKPDVSFLNKIEASLNPPPENIEMLLRSNSSNSSTISGYNEATIDDSREPTVNDATSCPEDQLNLTQDSYEPGYSSSSGDYVGGPSNKAPDKAGTAINESEDNGIGDRDDDNTSLSSRTEINSSESEPDASSINNHKTDPINSVNSEGTGFNEIDVPIPKGLCVSFPDESQPQENVTKLDDVPIPKGLRVSFPDESQPQEHVTKLDDVPIPKGLRVSFPDESLPQENVTKLDDVPIPKGLRVSFPDESQPQENITELDEMPSSMDCKFHPSTIDDLHRSVPGEQMDSGSGYSSGKKTMSYGEEESDDLEAGTNIDSGQSSDVSNVQGSNGSYNSSIDNYSKIDNVNTENLPLKGIAVEHDITTSLGTESNQSSIDNYAKAEVDSPFNSSTADVNDITCTDGTLLMTFTPPYIQNKRNQSISSENDNSIEDYPKAVHKGSEPSSHSSADGKHTEQKSNDSLAFPQTMSAESDLQAETDGAVGGIENTTSSSGTETNSSIDGYSRFSQTPSTTLPDLVRDHSNQNENLPEKLVKNRCGSEYGIDNEFEITNGSNFNSETGSSFDSSCGVSGEDGESNALDSGSDGYTNAHVEPFNGQTDLRQVNNVLFVNPTYAGKIE